MTALVLRLTCCLLGLAALGYRLWPMLAGEPWLSQIYLTADTAALLALQPDPAVGIGLHPAEGSLVLSPLDQALAAVLRASPAALPPLVLLAGLETLLSLAGALAVWAYARRSLPPMMQGGAWPFALAVAILWFSGPLLTRHLMSSPASGLQTLVVLLVLLWLPRHLKISRRAGYTAPSQPPGLPETLCFGALCGLLALVRPDGGLLILTVFAVWGAALFWREGLRPVLQRLVPAAAVTALVAWQGGWDQALTLPVLGAPWTEMLLRIPVKLFENMMPMLPVPAGLEDAPVILALCLFALAGTAFLYALAIRKLAVELRLMLLAYGLYGVLLCLALGAGLLPDPGVGQALTPLAPLMITASVGVLAQVLSWIRRSTALPATAIALSVALGLSGLLLGQAVLRNLQTAARLPAQGPDHAALGVAGRTGPMAARATQYPATAQNPPPSET